MNSLCLLKSKSLRSLFRLGLSSWIHAYSLVMISLLVTLSGIFRNWIFLFVPWCHHLCCLTNIVLTTVTNIVVNQVRALTIDFIQNFMSCSQLTGGPVPELSCGTNNQKKMPFDNLILTKRLTPPPAPDVLPPWPKGRNPWWKGDQCQNCPSW